MTNDSEVILDTRILEEMCTEPGRLDDPVLVGLVALFLREESPRLPELRRLADKRDGAELARLAHKLAGSCAVIGARQAYRDAQALEHMADAGSWTEVPAQLAAVEAAWSRLGEALVHHNLVRK